MVRRFPERWWNWHGAALLIIAEYDKYLAAWVRPALDAARIASATGIAAPIEGIPGYGQNDLGELYAALLGSGADIVAMNGVRKRFARWSGGRLAKALAPARVHCLIVSDVLGDDPASISSGPCTPDPLTAAALNDSLNRTALWDKLPASAREHPPPPRRGRTWKTRRRSG